MSNNVFDFLCESFLFNELYIEESYTSFTEKELLLELRKYREHIIRNLNLIKKEVYEATNEINTTIESFGGLPDDEMLKQLALYLDKIVIPDPIFKHTSERNKSHDAFSEYLNMKTKVNLDRIGLAKDCAYMKNKTNLVARQFIIFFPVALLHESPKELPLKYSETGFSDIITPDLMKFFHERVNVSNIKRVNGQMIIDPSDKLKIGTTIHIEFDRKNNNHLGMIYQFMKSEVINLNDETGEFTMRQYVPEEIDRDTFVTWLNQSVNQAAIKNYEDVFNEQVLANRMNCMYLTESQFVADLINKTNTNISPEQDLANLSLKLDLPVFNELSLNEIIKVRYNYGEAFNNFRVELQSNMLELRSITDPNELKIKMQNISHELSNTKIHEVNKEYRKLKRAFGLDSALFTGSLCASFFTGGLSLLGAAAASAKGASDYLKYQSEIKENNSYFLWQLNKEIQKCNK